METQMATASSVREDSRSAGREIAQQVQENLRGTTPDFLLLFTTEQYEQAEVLRGVRSIFPETPLIGFCGAGIFTGPEVHTRGVALMGLSSPGLQVHTTVVTRVGARSREAGREFARQAMARAGKAPYALLLTLPDPLTGCNVSEFLRGALEVTGAEVTYLGGGAGDNLRFIQTYQMEGDQVYQDAVAGALLLSQRPIGVAVRHGWKPLSQALTVTRSTESIVHELDWGEAFQVYRQAAGAPDLKREDFAAFAMVHPLGIPQAEEQFVVRDPIQVQEDGSLVCVGEVPQNSIVRVMQGSKEDMVQAAREAAETARAQLGGAQAAGAVLFDCVSRCLMLGEAFREELAAVQKVIGADVPLVGCLTFGEIGALKGGLPQFHNKTLSMALFGR